MRFFHQFQRLNHDLALDSATRLSLGPCNGDVNSLLECKFSSQTAFVLILQLPHSGHAIVAADNRSLIVSNLVDGIDVYSIPPIRPTRSFQHPIHTNVPLVVASALGGVLVIVGSDDGSPRLFNVNTGLLCAVLRHAPCTSCLSVKRYFLTASFFSGPGSDC